MESTLNSSDSHESKLLSLPPEVRNMIYRYALVGGIIRIQYPHPLPAVPGVLQANRQLREEGTDIYYKENDFQIDMYRYDPDVVIKWCNSSDSRWTRLRSFNFINHSDMVWTNLLRWLRAYFHCEVAGIGPPDRDDPAGTLDAASKLFMAVAKWREQGLTWEAVEDNLETMHSVLAYVDVDWT